MLAIAALVIVVTLVLCDLGESRSFPLQKTLTAQDDCKRIEEVGVGVGFDLTAGYGTAALSYRNGSKVAITKVEGTSEYVEVLARLSLASSQHLAPPYTNFPDAFRDKPRQAKRSARKEVGLPASEDVGALATMIKSLKDAVEGYLGYRICSATAATPHLLALYEEDVHDALEYHNLDYIPGAYLPGLLRETTAAYAGYGLGLCSNYTNLLACRDEQHNWPLDIVLAVLYTRTALTVAFSRTASAYYLWEPIGQHLEDFTLGNDAKHDNPREEYYWEMVRERLLELMVETYYLKPSKVLLLGESAGDKQFVAVLIEVLLDAMDDMPDILQVGAQDVAAMGAAELAMRSPWNPYRS